MNSLTAPPVATVRQLPRLPIPMIYHATPPMSKTHGIRGELEQLRLLDWLESYIQTAAFQRLRFSHLRTIAHNLLYIVDAHSKIVHSQ